MNTYIAVCNYSSQSVPYSSFTTEWQNLFCQNVSFINNIDERKYSCNSAESNQFIKNDIVLSANSFDLLKYKQTFNNINCVKNIFGLLRFPMLLNNKKLVGFEKEYLSERKRYEKYTDIIELADQVFDVFYNRFKNKMKKNISVELTADKSILIETKLSFSSTAYTEVYFDTENKKLSGMVFSIFKNNRIVFTDCKKNISFSEINSFIQESIDTAYEKHIS